MNQSRKAKLIPLLAAVTLLAACNRTTSSSSSTPDPTGSETPSESNTDKSTNTDTGSGAGEYKPYFGEEYNSNKITINVWTTAGDQQQTQLNNFVTKFKEVEPNVIVNNVKQSGSYDDLKEKIITGFAGNDYPDLTYCYPDHVAEYIYSFKAVDLTEYIDDPYYGWTAEDKNDIIPAFLEEGSKYSTPGIYSVPMSKSTEAMYYNPVLVGLDVSSVNATLNGNGVITESYLNSLTWDELLDNLAPTLKQYAQNQKDAGETPIWDSSDQYSAIVGYDSDDNLFITLAEQYGYGYTAIDETTGKGKVLFDNQGMKDLMKKLNKAYQDKLFITKGAANNEYINTRFTKKQVLFSIGSTGGVNYQFDDEAPMDVRVAPVPQAANGAKKALMSQGPSMCVLSHNKADGTIDKDRIMATWLFYRFMATTENSAQWALLSTGYMPIRESSYTTSQFMNITNLEGKEEATIDILTARNLIYCSDPDTTDMMFTSPVFVGSSACRSAAGGIVTQSLVAGSSLTDDSLNKIFSDAKNTAELQIK